MPHDAERHSRVAAALAETKLDGVVCSESTAAYYALQKKEYQEKFKIVGKPFVQEAYGFVVKKGNRELVELLNKGIRVVKARKIDEQLRKKWLR